MSTHSLVKTVLSCFVLVAFLNPVVEGQRTNQANGLLASIFNTASQAAASQGQRSPIRNHRIDALQPSVSGGTIIIDIMCSLCQKNNDTRCMLIHCVNADIPQPLLPSHQQPSHHNNAIVPINPSRASQLIRHESRQSMFGPHSHSGTVMETSNRLHQTRPLSWTHNAALNQPNLAPSQISFESLPAVPIQSNQINRLPQDPRERTTVPQHMFDMMFNAQQMLNRQMQQTTTQPWRPNMPTNQQNQFPGIFNPNIIQQQQQEVRPTMPDNGIQRDRVPLNIITGNQVHSNGENTWSDSMAGPRTVESFVPFVPNPVSPQNNQNHQPSRLPVDTGVSIWNRPQTGNVDRNRQIPPAWEFPDTPVSPVQVPYTSGGNDNIGTPMVRLPEAPTSSVDSNNLLNDLPQNIRDLFPEEFLNQPTSQRQNNQGNGQRNVEVPVAKDVFDQHNGGNQLPVVSPNGGIQDIPNTVQNPNAPPHVKMFEGGPQVVRDVVVETVPLPTNEPTAPIVVGLPDNAPVDLASTIITPFGHVHGHQISREPLNNHFLDFGHGPIFPKKLDTIGTSVVNTNNAHVHDVHPSPNTDSINPKTHTANEATTGHNIDGGNNVLPKPVEAVPLNDGLQFLEGPNAPKFGQMTIPELKEFLDIHMVPGVTMKPRPDGRLHPIQEALVAHRARLEAEANAESNNNNPPQEQTVDSNSAVVVEQIETTTTLPTMSPRRRNELNSLAIQFLRNFRSA